MDDVTLAGGDGSEHLNAAASRSDGARFNDIISGT